jgi:hypothetical protein
MMRPLSSSEIFNLINREDEISGEHCPDLQAFYDWAQLNIPDMLGTGSLAYAWQVYAEKWGLED